METQSADIKLPKRIKQELYKILREDPSAITSTEDKGIIPFISEICDLSSMKSEDSRFSDALGDFNQHLVNNDDWSYDYVFEERLNIIENDSRFNKFIEAIVNPKFRNGEDDILKYVILISTYIGREGYELAIQNYTDIGEPIYQLSIKTNDGKPFDIKDNDIVFYVEKHPKGREDWSNTHNKPLTYPAFVLSANNGWNDYNIYSSYYLFYYPEQNADAIHIGPVKIICNEGDITNEYLTDSFTKLNDSFCSLGQKYSYYKSLKEQLGAKKIFDILYALRDTAFFPEFQEQFDINTNYKLSLIRFDDAERLIREARYLTFDYDLSNLYSFKYLFKPKYSEEQIEVDFEFDNKKPIPNRIYALIGKNGTGKTQLITSLPLSISQKEDKYFIPRTPLFSRIIAVSYSMFDKFELPIKTSTFNYHYCGLRKNEKNENGEYEPYSDRGLVLRFHNTWKKIAELERINKWRRILQTFIDQELLDMFLIELTADEISSHENYYKVSVEGFNNVKNKFSSGQAILLYIITEIVAYIRYDSLLLYDEPETHLHPNAITQLMNTIYELTEEFQSYCIIATHSPLVVRELLSRNVFIIDRDNNTPSVRRISLESFGENLGVLTEEIFGNKGIQKLHRKIIEQLVDSGKTFEEIISLLEYDEVPLSLNARIFIKSLIYNRDKDLN